MWPRHTHTRTPLKIQKHTEIHGVCIKRQALEKNILKSSKLGESKKKRRREKRVRNITLARSSALSVPSTFREVNASLEIKSSQK